MQAVSKSILFDTNSVKEGTKMETQVLDTIHLKSILATALTLSGFLTLVVFQIAVLAELL